MSRLQTRNGELAPRRDALLAQQRALAEAG
jgi:hypothetical protein